ncbi:glycosyltransferase family 2 protein [Tamlana flava]|uniref:glycosyltransferase family 2 protein n=1 Tax=Tamlana flava TaxID=3158572 RepID=UPI00351AFCF5
MNSKPMVSVCMITYNHEKYIQEALHGVLMQVCDFEVELILANDCSTDNTHGVITSFLKGHERAHWVKYTNHTTNLGMMPNFIYALKQCGGKYMALCEGDDYWTDPLKLQKQVDFLENNHYYSGCFHNTFVINSTKESDKLKPWRVYNVSIFKFEDTISKIALFHTSSFVFRRKHLNLPDWFVNVQSGDMALFSLIAYKGVFFRIDDYMSVYRKNESGITNTITHKEYHKNRILLNKYFKATFDVKNHKKIEEVINYHTKELSNLNRGFFDKLFNKFKSKLKSF